MALPKEPRQKMINLMYLVLTALLALNVSAEILNAFKTVDNSLQKSSSVVMQSTANYMTSLQDKLNKPETKAKASIWLPKAQAAQQQTATIYNYINNLKNDLLKEADFDASDSSFKEDNLEASTRLLVENGKGKELLQKLTDYRTALLGIDPEISKEFSSNLPIDLTMPKTNSIGNNTWEAAYFRMTPTVAALTLLSKFQNDVKASENRIVGFCHNQVGAVDIPFDTYTPLVSSSAQYLMDGQEIEIVAGLGAFNSQKKPIISIGGSSVALGPDGLARQKFVANGVGQKTMNVTINYTDQDGNAKTETKTIEYVVGSPTGISVSADAVKVLYIGLENPISITGGLKGSESIQPSISQGNLTKKGSGQYIATVSTTGTAVISVKTSDGKTENFNFKVRNVPNPTPKVGRSAGGRVSANEFKAQIGLRADLEEFIFDGVKYEVTGYTVICTGKGFESIGPQVAENTGAAFSGEARRFIDMTKPGSSVIFDRIKVQGPGGSRTLPQTVAFNLY